jgi:hypothetical protein
MKHVCFFNLAEYGYFAESECFCQVKSMTLMEHSFHKVSQFSKGHNVQHISASNLSGVLHSDTHISQLPE